MQTFIGLLMAISGLLGIIGSAIVVKFSGVILVVMTILNTFEIINIAWFAGPFTAGAISTGIWMFVLGLLMLVLSYIITFIGGLIIQ